MPEAEVVVDAHAHLGSRGGPSLLLERFARHPGEALLTSLLTCTEPIAHPLLDVWRPSGATAGPKPFHGP